MTHWPMRLCSTVLSVPDSWATASVMPAMAKTATDNSEKNVFFISVDVIFSLISLVRRRKEPKSCIIIKKSTIFAKNFFSIA